MRFRSARWATTTIVNDMLGGVPIAATYCTLCHTGIVYDRRLNGQTLTFFLAGINNGNALLRDRETGTIWQQSTGEGIFGPLKGQHLTLIPSDELTFALWRNERPHGLILRPDPTNAALYDPADWEAHIARTHVVVPTPAAGPDPHTIMLGLEIQGETKAFPIGSILSAHVIEDHLAGQPILLMTGPDNASIRAFTPRAGDRTLTFVSNPEWPGRSRDVEPLELRRLAPPPACSAVNVCRRLKPTRLTGSTG